MHGIIKDSYQLKPVTRKSTPVAGMRKWFPWMVAFLVVALGTAGSYHIYQTVEDGMISWWPYPTFALFVALVFLANTKIYQDR